jgi:hypothetical protein
MEVRWRSLQSTSLGKRCASYTVPPTSRKRAADRWSLLNFSPRSPLLMVGKAQKSHGARSGLYGGCSNGVPSIHFFQAEHRIQFRSRPMPFLGFSNYENGVPRQEIWKWSTVCSTFSRSGWSIVRSASLAKGRTSERRPSPHLHNVPTQSNKVSQRTLQTALVYTWAYTITTPVPTVARSKARIVLNRSNIAIVGSNPARGMDMFPRYSHVLPSCVGRGLVMGRSPVQGVLPNI